MRTLIYKRTHSNDPDPETGVFGNRDCMGQVRAWDFDAVIGIGGVGDEPKRHGIAGKLTWIGIGPQKFFDDPDRRGPQLVFRHFKYFGEDGPLLVNEYPALARHIRSMGRGALAKNSMLTTPSRGRTEFSLKCLFSKPTRMEALSRWLMTAWNADH